MIGPVTTAGRLVTFHGLVLKRRRKMEVGINLEVSRMDRVHHGGASRATATTVVNLAIWLGTVGQKTRAEHQQTCQIMNVALSTARIRCLRTHGSVMVCKGFAMGVTKLN